MRQPRDLSFVRLGSGEAQREFSQAPLNYHRSLCVTHA